MSQVSATPGPASPDTGPGAPPPSGSRPAERLVSLDVLRGFDMFWIVGAAGLVRGLKDLSDAAPIAFLATQLEHVPWAGFHFYDLIFPLFIFMTGTSMAFSLPKALATAGRGPTVLKILRRFVLLYLLGIFYYMGDESLGDAPRLVGVLQRIGFCYLATGILFLFLRKRGLVIAAVACLVGYWALLTFVPVPGVGAGVIESGKNLSDWFDSQYLPGAKYNGTFDPEGLLSTIPAVATCLMGLFAGFLMRDRDITPPRKLRTLILWGVGCAAAGWLWHLQFPVIKTLWTSSYVLVSGGYSLLLLGLFYWLVDLRPGEKRWTEPLLWIGTNPITIYMAYNLVPFRKIAGRLIKGPVKEALGDASQMAVAVLMVGMSLALLRFMYRRKIFLRI